MKTELIELLLALRHADETAFYACFNGEAPLIPSDALQDSNGPWWTTNEPRVHAEVVAKLEAARANKG